MFAVRQRSGIEGKGARLARIAVGLAETGPIADAVLKSFVALPESFLNTDSSPAYAAAGKRSRGHFVVEHGKELSGPNGENNNQAEELNGRYDRAEKASISTLSRNTCSTMPLRRPFGRTLGVFRMASS